MAYDFDLIARRYDSMNHLMTCYTDVLWRRRAVRSLLRNRNCGHYLDVATGTGDMAKSILHYAESGSSLVGVDLSRQMLTLAKKKLEGLNCELLQADAECLPFEDNTFDIIVCNASFHHYTRPDDVLREMRHVLKAGGKLLIGDPYVPGIARPLINVLIKFSQKGDYHFYGFNEMQELFLKNEFIPLSSFKTGEHTALHIAWK